MCADNVVHALLRVGGLVAIREMVTGYTMVTHDASAVERTARGGRRSLPMWTSLGARPVAALTELL